MNDRPAAVVTGAGRGIGRAIALELSAAGFNIAGIDLIMESDGEEQGLEGLREPVEANGSVFLPLQGDIADVDGHGELISGVMDRFGRIDIFVNNAGVAPLERMDILETTPESFDRVLAVNLRGAFFLTQAVVPLMLEGPGPIAGYPPAIVFITSISAEVSSTNRAEYCISKAGLSMTARVFADRLAGEGIAVYEIRPGIIETDMTAPVKEQYDKLIADGLVPLGRWGQPEDVAKVVFSIACGDLAYSTGAVIEVSGGMNIRSL